MITLINRQRSIPIDIVWLEKLVAAVLDSIDYSDFNVQILITTNKTIATYNEGYRNKKGPTDILSFRFYPEQVPGKKVYAENGEQNIGDLILSAEYIVRSAKKLGISFEHRLMILCIHGIVHLLGYDHETDQDYAQMQAVEDTILAQLPSKLIKK
mgnify:CR=1 FL=1